MSNITGWLFWLLAIGINGFFVFLWTVFGLAGAGSTSGPVGQGLVWGTVFGVGVPLIISAYQAKQENFGRAIGLTMLFTPFSIVLFFLFANVLRKL